MPVLDAAVLKLGPVEGAIFECGLVKTAVFEIAASEGNSPERSTSEIASLKQAVAESAVFDCTCPESNVNEPGLDYVFAAYSLLVTLSSLDQNSTSVIESFVEKHLGVKSPVYTSKTHSRRPP